MDILAMLIVFALGVFLFNRGNKILSVFLVILGIILETTAVTYIVSIICNI